MSSELELKRFGRYLILDHLVDGGMARICRARFLGEQADKIVAIKMIRAQYSQNPSFKKMFMDEIKVTFGLIHPNIAQTYDYGILNNQLYTAMEYVDGKNLKQFLETLKERKYIFPIEISTYVISQVCQALSYAHNFTDKLTGKSLNIIHRDISPHNIMITYDGSVKVIDFGIAKANTNSEETQAGTIKGKLSYLAPEYLEGVSLDHTYDQFAVGVTLWEMLCGRKLFQAENEMAILKVIQKCKVPPPSTINKKVSKEMDDIVLKALSKDRTKRYENMDQFNRALVKYLYSSFPDFNSSDLSYFAKELFKDDIAKDKKKFVEFGKVNLSPYIEDLKKEMEKKTESSIKVGESAVTHTQESKGERVLELSIDDEKTEEITRKISLDLNPKKDEKSIGNQNRSKIIRTKVATGDVESGSTGSRTLSSMKDKKKKSNSNNLFFVFVLLFGGFVAFGIYKTEIFKQKSSVDNVASRDVSSIQDTVKKDKNIRRVMILNKRPFQKFFVDNVQIEAEPTGLDFPMYKDIKLRVEEDGYRPIFMTFQVTENAPDVINLPSAKEGRFGILDASASVFEGKILRFYVDGNEVEKKLPANDIKIPVGEYDAVIIDDDSNINKEISFTIKEDTLTRLPF